MRERAMTKAKPTGGDEADLAVIRLAQEIRRLRTAERLSQPDLAAMIGYTPQYVSLAERPHKGLPSAALVTAIDKALGAGGALIKLHRQAKVQRQALHTSRAPETAPALSDASTSANAHSDELEGVDDTKRRQLLASAAAITFGAALDQPARRIIAQADSPQVPATVRAGDVRDLRTTVAMLEDWDHRAGGVAVRHHILGVLRWGTGLLDGSCTPDVRATLAATVAQLADLAAWATFDAGLYAQARDLFLLGLHAARESGDLGIRAHVATGLARQEIHMGNVDTALELVQLAHTAADTLTPNAVSMLHTVKALAYAKRPDADQCRRFAQLAADRYRPETAADDPPWIQFFTPAKLTGDTANAMFDLLVSTSPLLGQAEATRSGSRARADLVVRLSDTVNGYSQGRARSKAIAASRLATLLYLEGAPTEANQAARTALSLAGDVRSTRLGTDLRVLARATGAAPRDPLAQTLRTQANVLAATMI
jgi:transcriptional regulator with XRE-family HTH domain